MDIIVVGSLNMDIVAVTKKMPLIGETVRGEKNFISCGGKGANQAVAIGKLGGNIKMIGCVGKDVFGETLIENLKNNNINCESVFVKEEAPTGTAVIVVQNTDNFIILDGGANDCLYVDDILTLEDNIAKSKVVVMQLESPMEVVDKVSEICRENGVKFILNPAPAVKLEDGLLRKINTLILNETETSELMGIGLDDVNFKEAISFFKNKGVENTIITLGSKGVIFNYEDDIVSVPAYKVEAVDTTSAGDSFIGAYVTKIVEGKNVEEAIKFAVAVSALTVMKSGAQDSIPTLKEVENFLSNQ